MSRPLLRLLALLLAAAAVAVLPRVTHRSAPPAPPASRSDGTDVAPVPAPSGGFGARVGFRTTARWLEHFREHGRELGCADADAYLRLAQGLRDRPAGGDLLELTRDDGVVTRYDRASGVFVAFERDGTLRTCFRPRDGEAYFRRQALRGRT